MKNLYFIFLLFVSVNLSAQTKGITYQAIIYNPSGESIPGVNNATAPMANKSVCLQFSIVDASSQVEYQELISTTTDEYGMVNLVIGNGVQSSGYASSFSTIAWSVDQKSLKVALDIAGQCSDFVDISNQKFESVPYAFSANTADNISGILPIENGGTNASTVLGAKTNLGLENVDNTSDLNKPISTATQTALDLKENQINKSAVTTLGTSDVLYPTQNAVKSYVDASATNINTAIANEAAIRAAADNVLTTNLATEVTNRINGDNILTTNLATEVTNRINGDNTLTTNLLTEVLNRTNADVILTNNLATEVTNRTNADLLKEDLVNKSTATALGNSDILYPSQNAVKTYVDATSTTNTTAINNEAAIRAAADVVLTNNLATEVTNRTNADLLKENLANKSTATGLGSSNDLYPTQNAVKTYVDASASTNAAAVTNEAAIRAAADVVLTNNLATEVTNRTNADLLKENLANKSTNTTLGTSDILYPSQNAVKSYVDANAVNATNALNNEAAIRAAADVLLTNNLATEVTNRTIGDNNLATAINTEVTNRTNADLLKENLANKSTDVILDGSSNTKYPTVKSMKDYVDASSSAATGSITNEAAIRAAADVILTNNLATEVTNRTNADLLKEDLVNKSNNIVVDGTSTIKYPTVKTVKDFVDSNAIVAATNITNEAAARAAADNTLTTNLNTEANSRINGDLLKENTANKSTATGLGTSDVLFPTQKAVKTYVDANTTSNTTAISNEAAIRAAADVVLTNDIAAEVAARAAADVVLTNDIAAEVAARAAADVVLTNNLAAEAAARTAADLLKENTANKSTTTTLGTSDVLFPTQNAVKTYVDASTAAGTTGLNNEAAIRAAADVVLTNDIAAEAAARTAADLLKENTANKSTTTTLGTSDVLFPTQNAVKTYVDAQVATATIADADATTKGKLQLAGDLAGTAAAPTVPGLALKAPIASPTFTGTPAAPTAAAGTNTTQVATTEFVTGAIATATIPDATTTAKGKIQLAGDLAGTAAAPTVPGLALKAPIASPTFTGTVTSPIYASTPQALTDAATISWNPTNGLNASVTLGGNRTLSFASLPAVGSYGTLIVTQDATGNRTITLPSTSNKVLGSASTTTIALSTAANAKDILNFYYDGTNCYWNIGQGYGTAATAAVTNLTSSVSGTLPVANGGTGATTLTGIVKGNGTGAMTAAIAGTDYVAPSGNITGTASNITGTVAVANGGTGATNASAALYNLGGAPLSSPALTGTPTAPTASAGTNTAQVATTAFVTSALSTSGLPSQSGNNGKFLTTNGSSASWASGVSGSGTLNYIPKFSSSSALANSSLSDDGTGLRIGNPNGTNGIYTGLSSYDNTRLMVAGGRESESIRMTFPGDPYNNELSFNWYNSAWRMRTERSGGEITDLSFWKTTGAGVTTEKMRIDQSGYVKATGFKTQSGTSSQFLKANGTVDNSTYLSGTVSVANGGTGTTTLTGYVKGNGTAVMTASANIPVADVSGAAPLSSPTFTGTPAAPTASAGTNSTQVATTAFVTNALSTSGLPSQSGNNGKFLTTNGTSASWASSAGVPYSGATGAVNLGDYNLTVRGIKIGTSGTDNFALQNNMVIGRDALVNNTNGYNNIAMGNTALGLNVGGYNNLAIGNEAQYKNLWGWGNVSLGIATLNQNVVGNFNTAVGHGAGYFLTSSYNTAIGHNALDGQANGGGNTGVGVNAGGVPWNQTTYNSTFLGYNAKAQSGLDNVIVIGYNAYTNEHNTIQLGNGSIVKLKTSGTIWSNGTQLTSDVRLKTNIQPLQNSLEVIMKLNPVHYDKKNSIESTDYNKSENGFIAQEIQKVLPFVVKEGTDQDKILSVDYNSIIPVLTKGIQEQQLQIEAQQKQIDEMKMLIEKLVKEKK
jgi:hypothetical protein